MILLQHTPKLFVPLQNAQATILSARQKVSMLWFGLGFRVWGLGFRAVIKSGFKRV